MNANNFNLYNFHENPSQLAGYDQAHEKIPVFIWNRYKKYSEKNKKEELEKRKEALAKDPKFAYMYALIVEQGRFPEGEDAIGRNTDWAFHYAMEIVKGRFPKGESAIKQNSTQWEQYTAYLELYGGSV